MTGLQLLALVAFFTIPFLVFVTVTVYALDKRDERRERQ